MLLIGYSYEIDDLHEMVRIIKLLDIKSTSYKERQGIVVELLQLLETGQPIYKGTLQ